MKPELPSLENFDVTVAEPGRSEVSRAEDLSLESEFFPLLSSSPLHQCARPGMRVVIAFTDSTRPSPDRILISQLRSELERAGVRPEEITLLCAVGLHRPMSEDELRAKLGDENMRDVRVVNHSAIDPEILADLGEIDGIPVSVNRLCAEADLMIATGIVEPHQYAGFSGGAKTVAIGCAGEETIRATHGIEMLDRPGTRLGRIEGNPFQHFVRAVGERIGLRYVANVLLDADGGIVAAACGEPNAVHDRLASIAGRACVVTVECPAHVAIAGVPSAKGANLYQATRAATYLPFSDRTPLLPGAPIILPAAIPEGAGEGTGERHFFEALSGAISPDELIERFRREGCEAGAQRAYIVARVLAEHPIIVVGAEHPEIVHACHMETASNMETALARAEEIARARFDLPLSAKPHLLIVPNALATLVTLARST